MTEKSLPIKSDAPARCQISGDTGELGDGVMQRGYAREGRTELAHEPRNCITHAGDDLKQRKVGVSHLVSDQMLPPRRVLFEHTFEVAKNFGTRFSRKSLARRFASLLIFIIQGRCNRMMHLMHLRDEVRHRQP